MLNDELSRVHSWRNIAEMSSYKLIKFSRKNYCCDLAKTLLSFPRDIARPTQRAGSQQRRPWHNFLRAGDGAKRHSSCLCDVVTSYRGEELTTINRHFCTCRRKIKPAAKFCIMESSFIGRTVDRILLWKALLAGEEGTSVITLSRFLLPSGCLDKYTVYIIGDERLGKIEGENLHSTLSTMHSRDSPGSFSA